MSLRQLREGWVHRSRTVRRALKRLQQRNLARSHSRLIPMQALEPRLLLSGIQEVNYDDASDSLQAVTDQVVADFPKDADGNPQRLTIDIQSAASMYRVTPYVQRPASDAMTLTWLSVSNSSAQLGISTNPNPTPSFNTSPQLASALSYHANESATPQTPYLHQVRISSLLPDTTYYYTVVKDGEQFSYSFTTAPGIEDPIRFMVYADSKTEQK